MEMILIIDDEESILKVFKKILEREGFNVIVASDGKKGMSLFKKESVDLVITDIIMPEQEGLETIAALKRVDSELPIIAMSGGGRNSPEDYLKAAKTFGAKLVLRKPIEKNVLLNAVNEIMLAS